jgi:hypothetical protein
LIVLDANGHYTATWTGPNINGPWGNMALIDNGSTAQLFVSMAGFDVPGPEVRDPKTGYPVVINKATILRLDLSIPDGKPPVITKQTVIADGLGERADKDAFLAGPTGLALAPDGTLYASDAIGNRIVAIPNAATRTDSAGTGTVVTKDGLLKRPLALILLPNVHLLCCNAQNGEVVEIDPVGGKQIYAQWIDPGLAQSPSGNGDLFGILGCSPGWHPDASAKAHLFRGFRSQDGQPRRGRRTAAGVDPRRFASGGRAERGGMRTRCHRHAGRWRRGAGARTTAPDPDLWFRTRLVRSRRRGPLPP